MATIKNAPNQPFIETKGQFDWENESTLVDRRNRLPNRIMRLVRSVWFWVLLLGILTAALLDASVMRGILSLLEYVVLIGYAIAFILVQFIAMYSFASRSRQYTIMPGAEGVSFKDYRGQPEILEQAKQIVTLLRGVKAFEGAGGEPLNGLLLEGPPGTGKTWLAQAISTEAGVPYFYVDTASLQGTFMGMGAIKMMRLYGKARKASKEYGAAVIFLDEIDAIGSRSGVSAVGGGTQGGTGGMGSGSMGLLSTMLIEMSGFSLEHGWWARRRRWFYRTFLRRNPPPPQKRVLTIGATNRVQALDPALLRPGRFDKKLRVDVPDMEGRRDIFEYYLSKMASDASMNPVVLASETPGYTPADIKYLLNETLRFALFAGRRYMTYEDFQRAKPEHEMGIRSPLKHMSKEAKKHLAYYQAGRAVAVRLFLPDHRISRVTIIRQGTAYGHVSHYPARESYTGLTTRDQYLNYLRALVAGKSAEIEFCGAQNQTLNVVQRRSYTSVYEGDLGQIRMWLNMMARAGMFGPLGATVGMSPDMPADMADAMEAMLEKISKETRMALRENAHIVNALVELLLEREELMADDVKAFFDQYNLFTPEPSLIRDGEEVRLLPELMDEAEALENAAPST